MATAAPSPLASSPEKTNGNKLSRLLIDGGTTVLRNIFDHYHPPANLASDLNSNYSILNNLLRRRVLNGHQWDKLFPSGGGLPDSNTFDITLLFLLLTNICGLSPPLTGWHTKPSPGDNSLEANLARVKFFRNELYGHVTSTAFDAAIFSSLWQEISAALLSLGLDQAEIDRLKAESGGEEDYLDALFEWADSDVEIKTELKDIRQSQAKIQEVLQLKEDRRKEDQENEVLKKLAVVDTKKVIQTHLDKYQEGTRMSVFEKVSLWLNDRASDNRAIVITGNAGMGKSVIGAVICRTMDQAGRLAGSHFCQHNKERYRNPKIMLQSLAYQLSEFLPQYKRELVKALSRNLGEDINNLEVGELFELLLEEPLRNVDDPGESVLMVIDGLDETEYKGRNELLDVIDNHFSALPVWFRFCVTTRPEIIIAKHLQKLNPLHLQQDDEGNVNDIRMFFETQLGNVIQSGFEEVVISELVEKADGHILYAYLMVDFIKKNVSLLTPEELGRTLPSGVSSVYQSYFERLEKELTISEELFLTFLSALAATKEPLSLDFVSKMLLSDIKSPAGHRKVRQAIECISTLLPVQDGCIHFFHKSVKDWLTDGAPDMYGVQHKFYVNEDQGHRALSQLCVDELDDVKRKSVHGTDFSDAAKYALQYGVGHMLELEESARASSRFQEIINNYVTDLDIVHAKLCVHNTVNSEDIIRVQEREAFKSLSDESQRALSTLFSLLRKYHGRLSTHPSTIFQVMVNEGGDFFAGEATKVLQSREIPYMEYLHKEAVKKESQKTQAEFPCNSKLACFDISPTQEFMVCECTDGMIYLWSLKTGEQRWVRPVEVKKCYSRPFCHFRVVPNSNVFSCYRSVVFHPTEPIVLPGILSHAYSFEGNLQPLFPKSNCRFSVCSVHGGVSKIITDCPGDAKCLVMWNLKNGEEITRTIRNEDVLSFAWSPDGTLLAISHFSGLVCLVDALNCLDTTLAEVATKQPCGMIKFAPDTQFLFCLSWSFLQSENERNDRAIIEPQRPLHFHLNVIKLPCGAFSLNVLDEDFGRDLWNYESSSKGGFFMGDPIFYRISSTSKVFCEGFAFVLNNQRVLMVLPDNKKITMLQHKDHLRATWYRPFNSRIEQIAFAPDGKTIYGTSVDEGQIFASLDVSSGDQKVRRMLHTRNIFLVPVSDGAILKGYSGANVWLWNYSSQDSQEVTSWPDLSHVRDIMPFSDQCVACVGEDFKVSILDTSNGNIVTTIPLGGEGFQSTKRSLRKEAILCNSKYQLLCTTPSSVQLSDGKNVLWKRTLKFRNLLCPEGGLPGMFSPTEDFLLISSLNPQFKEEVLVLEACSGTYLRTLCTVDSILGCVFVSKTECVIVCKNTSGSYCLQLFNVNTGDFLTVLDIDFEPSRCLASCLQKGLIAIGLENSKCMCAVIQVKQLRDKVNREAKGEQCVFFLSLVEELLSLRSVDRSHRPTLNWPY